jgi:hypothetical protein
LWTPNAFPKIFFSHINVHQRRYHFFLLFLYFGFYHNGYKFITKDRDDGHRCAALYKGGWWYSGCHRANLNGQYFERTLQTFLREITTWSLLVKVRVRVRVNKFAKLN